MKKINIILLLIIIIISSCQFNQSINTDLITGAHSRGNGIACNDIAIEINGKVERRNEFVFGEKVNLIFNNINGLTNADNKMHPGLSIHIIKNEKDTVVSNPNLLQSLKNGTDLFPLRLQANFTVNLPHQNNEKYEAHINIWDKKGDGKFTYELPFTIKENNLLNIENNGVKFSSIYLWNETLKQAVPDNTLNPDHLYLLILNDIEGFEVSNEKIFPVFSMDLTDNNGTKIISNPNMLSDFENEGINPKDIKRQLIAKIILSEGEPKNPYNLTVTLKDKKSSKEIKITMALNLK